MTSYGKPVLQTPTQASPATWWQRCFPGRRWLILASLRRRPKRMRWLSYHLIKCKPLLVCTGTFCYPFVDFLLLKFVGTPWQNCQYHCNLLATGCMYSTAGYCTHLYSNTIKTNNLHYSGALWAVWLYISVRRKWNPLFYLNSASNWKEIASYWLRGNTACRSIEVNRGRVLKTL